ncbi:MAG: hypothetical protein J6S67_14365 [Methanobrevibacter sp.]|nr:hypothetical protein [Methanobrevibacter sp.]
MAQSPTMKNLIRRAVVYAAKFGEHYSKTELETAALELANEAINEATCNF